VTTSNAIDGPNNPEAPTPNEQYSQFADSDIVLSIANLCTAAEQEDFSAASMPSAEESSSVSLFHLTLSIFMRPLFWKVNRLIVLR